MNITELPDKEQTKLILGLPSKRLAEVCSVILVYNEITDNYAIVKCRYDLRYVDITKLDYIDLKGTVEYSKLQDLENKLLGKNIIINRNFYIGKKECIDIIESC